MEAILKGKKEADARLFHQTDHGEHNFDGIMTKLTKGARNEFISLMVFTDEKDGELLWRELSECPVFA